MTGHVGMLTLAQALEFRDVVVACGVLVSTVLALRQIWQWRRRVKVRVDLAPADRPGSYPLIWRVTCLNDTPRRVEIEAFGLTVVDRRRRRGRRVRQRVSPEPQQLFADGLMAGVHVLEEGRSFQAHIAANSVRLRRSVAGAWARDTHGRYYDGHFPRRTPRGLWKARKAGVWHRSRRWMRDEHGSQPAPS